MKITMLRSLALVTVVSVTAVFGVKKDVNAQAVPTTVQAARPTPVAAQAQGAVVRYVVGPMGRVQAAVLDSGTVVMLHRHGDEVAQRVSVGGRIRVDGFAMPGSTNTIMGATVTDASGNVIAQGHRRGMQQGAAQGQRGQRHAMREAAIAALPVRSTSGTVQTVLAGRGGHVHAVVMSDGTSVFLPRDIAQQARAQGLAVGQRLSVQGHGNQYAHGASLVASEVTFASGTRAVHQ